MNKTTLTSGVQTRDVTRCMEVPELSGDGGVNGHDVADAEQRGGARQDAGTVVPEPIQG